MTSMPVVGLTAVWSAVAAIVHGTAGGPLRAAAPFRTAAPV
ncbi:hypothetical protein ACIO93_10370 [Streptomyces sp. NPDC087903]